MNEPITTIVGNLTGPPELRFTPGGDAVCNFTVASTPRVKAGGDWTDGESMFVRCAAWKQLAENVAESFDKGTRVLVMGRLKVRSWEKDGQKRTGIEMDVEAVGPELRYATAKPQRVESGGGQQRRSSRAPEPQYDDEAPF